jgi:hypothetical protein
MFYPYRTIARAAYNNAHPNVTTVTERMRTMLTNELFRKERLDPPINVLPYLDIRTDSQTARTARNTKPYQMTVWEDIDSMAARAGLDYTVIGRRILGWDVHHSIGQTATLTEQDFLDEVIVTEYGMELATYSAVTDSEGNWGAVGIGQPGSESIDPYYGEWELLNTSYAEDVSDTSTPTTKPSTAELRSQAARNLAGRHPAPVVVRVPDNASLDPRSTALSISDSVPGRVGAFALDRHMPPGHADAEAGSPCGGGEQSGRDHLGLPVHRARTPLRHHHPRERRWLVTGCRPTPTRG